MENQWAEASFFVRNSRKSLLDFVDLLRAASHLRAALKIVKAVDAGAIARAAAGKSGTSRSDAITAAIRAKRLSALRAWKRAAVVPVQTAKSS